MSSNVASCIRPASPSDDAAAGLNAQAGEPLSGAGDLVDPIKTMALVLAGALGLAALSILWLDAPIARYALARPPGVHQVAQFVTLLGLSSYMLLASAAIAIGGLLCARKTPPGAERRAVALLVERALFVFVTVAASGLLAQVLKHLVGRARPRLIDDAGVLHFVGPSIKASLASLPSGHATSIFAVAVALALMLPRMKWVLLAVALLVAASRAVVGAHYTSDVVAGAALGTLVTLGLAKLAAERGLAFTLDHRMLHLKGRGLMGPALRACFRSGVRRS